MTTTQMFIKSLPLITQKCRISLVIGSGLSDNENVYHNNKMSPC